MAMEDPRVLLYMNMSFNPFRSSPHPSSPSPSSRSRPSPQQRTLVDDPDNDSWHTNSPGPASMPIPNSNESPSSHQKRSPSAVSWFSGWTTSASTISKTLSQSTTTTTTSTALSSAIIIQDGRHANNHSASVPPSVSSHHPPLSSQTYPAESMTMNRGMNTPKSEKMHQTVLHHQDSHSKSISSLPYNELGVANARGGIPVVPQNNGSSSLVSSLRSSSRIKKPIDENNESGDHHDLGLPPYPEPSKAPQTQTMHPSRTNKALLEDFPTPKTKATHPVTIGATPNTSPSFRHKQIFEESTFPGFALIQTAKAHYCLGRYSQALNTTTQCLALQKTSFNGNKGSAGSAPATVITKKGIASHSNAETTNRIPPTGSPAASFIRKGLGDANDTTMTALDLRSSFVTGVGSSVLGVVKSLKGSSESATMGGGSSRMNKQLLSHHPMLSNSIAIMVSQYPSHPCVAQTLLLRGRLLATCGLFGFGGEDGDGGDFSLLLQAVQNVEMSIAIQRKLAISDVEELATPLLFLGNMKSRLGHFDEANMAYKEALSILRDVRTSIKNDNLEAVKRDDAEVASDCAQYLQRITGEIATALYLHGKSYHCQRMHAPAFDCYNNALVLLKKIGAGQDNNLSVKRSIVRCMKNKCALEKLVSAYWDEPGVI